MAWAMRRLTGFLLLVPFTAAALALGACGGGDDEKKSADENPGISIQPGSPPSGTTAGAGATAGSTGGSGKSRKSRKSRRKANQGSGGGSTAADDLAGSQQPKSGGKKTKINKEVAKGFTDEGQAEISYDAARTVCSKRSLKDIKATYDVKGEGNENVAKAVSKEYKPSFRRAAAYAGCLKGLSER